MAVLVLPAFALALLTAGTVQAAAQEAWRFRVLLDGDEIGRHVFEAREGSRGASGSHGGGCGCN
jgi:hypothetical protein